VRSRGRASAAALSGNETAGLWSVLARHPHEFVGLVLLTTATVAIFVNALFLQHGPHPAPIFASKPLLAAEQPVTLPRPRGAEPQAAPTPAAALATRAQTVSDIQRALAQRGFYDGTVDGVWGAKTDTAARDFLSAAGLKLNPEAGGPLLRAILSSNVKAGHAAPVRNDPIAALIAPSKRVLAVQRALADFGYGQLKPTGTVDPDTQAAIAKFERDHQMPVTGDVSEPLVRELAAMTGRPLE
jgi:peptidoglycan hydrolase-like protein with peptidoglycan-binding domain